MVPSVGLDVQVPADQFDQESNTDGVVAARYCRPRLCNQRGVHVRIRRVKFVEAFLDCLWWGLSAMPLYYSAERKIQVRKGNLFWAVMLTR